MKPQSIYNKMFEPIPIMESYRGSIVHNLYIEPNNPMSTDDIDTIKVYAYPKQYYFTLEGYNKSREVYERKEGEFDEVAYEIRKMFYMLSNLNPNVLNTLYLRPEDYIQKSEAWDHVLKNKDIFRSKEVYVTYAGYARSQFTRMMQNSKLGYMGEKRFEIVKEHGYDTKNASHLIRLLRSGIEFLKTGELTVYRISDRDELISIKQGKWTLEQVQTEADRLLKEFDTANNESKLPETVNKYNVNKLLYEVMEMIL